MLGVLQALEVMRAPWGEEMGKLENCMRRAGGVGQSMGEKWWDTWRKETLVQSTEHNRLQESVTVPRTHFGHQPS